ncbi:MAG: sodium:solute symporter family protein [Bacteroidetes bacterium]|nr:sodium:solute symporter family protein [Rhodothermia bacterium]MCS7155049.1 sodium:solute symporter family protein [Bacteroidota bacterium]MCX7907333.1 sodium:solute symporter family protein [Bacteroidota bacterium]MDW8137940.1 sodium:solute symporter family protein [Bacteroidota bacterium]MDW8286208.1 sodium:solute symporter family protein [Bacteroidota bacterium]
MPFRLHLIDWALVGAYALWVLYRGFWRARARSQAAEDFLLAGRALTAPAFVATLVSTWYGGILGVGEYAYRYGISQWLVFGLPYYVFALLFALFWAEPIRRSGALSVPDRLRAVYGPWAGLLGALWSAVLASPAPYVYMLGLLVQAATGLPFVWALLLGAVASGAYVWTGGFRAVVRTDAWQFGLMYLGFGLIVPWLVLQYGGWAFLRSALPPSHWSWDGGQGLGYVLVWFFVALWTFVDPGFHQRVLAARSPETARKGILGAVLFWVLFDALTTAAGLYARALLRELAHPALAYPALAEQALPPGLKGLFWVGLLATIMSTVDSYLLLSAQMLGFEVLGRWHARWPAGTYVRVGLLATLLLALLIALWAPGVIAIWYTLGTLMIPGLLLPTLGAYAARWRPSRMIALGMLIGGPLCALLWMALARRPEGYWGGIEPLYAGLAWCVLLWLANLVRERLFRGSL